MERLCWERKKMKKLFPTEPEWTECPPVCTLFATFRLHIPTQSNVPPAPPEGASVKREREREWEKTLIKRINSTQTSPRAKIADGTEKKRRERERKVYKKWKGPRLSLTQAIYKCTSPSNRLFYFIPTHSGIHSLLRPLRSWHTSLNTKNIDSSSFFFFFPSSTWPFPRQLG